MPNWDLYNKRLYTDGKDESRAVNIARRQFKRRYMSNPSYKSTIIDGRKVGMQIYATEEYHEKTFNAPFDEIINPGDYVLWGGYHWLVTDIDYTEIVTRKGYMVQCNYVLKWEDDTGRIIEKPCFIEDGTKYIIGENAREYMTIGDSRMALTVPKDKDTANLTRGVHLLVDDPDAPDPSAFGITKANRVQHVYDGKGIYRLMLNEVNSTQDDDVVNMVARPIEIEGSEGGWF